MDDMDKIRLVILLLRAGAKKLYHSIHIYINEDAAIRDKKLFNPNNVLRTWEGFRQCLVCSFCGHWDRDCALRELNGLSMQAGKIDLFRDELIRLANELKYGGDYVKDKAHVGMTTDLFNVWAVKTPHPEDYVHYLNLQQNTGLQPEDVASFNRTVVRARDSSHHDKSDDRHTSTKKQRKERRVRALAIPNLPTHQRGLSDHQAQSMQKRIKI